MDFFEAMIHHNPLLLNGLIAGLLASICCGIIGPYVITRRIVMASGAISHMAIGGVGVGLFMAYMWVDPAFRQGLEQFTGGLLAAPEGDIAAGSPTREQLDQAALLGAMGAAVIGALLIGLVHQRIHERMDTLLGAMWAVGMSIGLVMLKLTPAYQTEVTAYLFGNISFVPRSELWILAALAGCVLLTVLVFHKRFVAICLDQQQAELQGINTLWTNLVLLVLVAFTVLTVMRVVGLVLVLALLALPAATAGHHATRLVHMMWISVLLCVLLTTVPRILVYGTPISPEPATVLAAGGVYLGSVILRRAVLALR